MVARSTLRSNPFARQGYPWLGESARTGAVVLFNAPGEGTVLHPSEADVPLGLFSDQWDMDVFVGYDGEITLSND